MLHRLRELVEQRNVRNIAIHLDLELLDVVHDLDPVAEVTRREGGHGDFGDSILQRGSGHLLDRAAPPAPVAQNRRMSAMTLGDAWEAEAKAWIAWARAPGHDSYARYHRDQFFRILPPPGRRTIDVGCGEGRLSRDLAARGHSIIAIDRSPTLVAAARAADPAMDVRQADAAALPLDDASADLAIAFMSLQDIDDLEGAVREIARVLAPNGRFCAAVVHPLNAAGAFEQREAQARFIIAGDYLRSFRYATTVERDGLAMTFHSVHRSLETYFAAFEGAGLVVEALREPAVPDEAITDPASARWQRVPLFLHLRARRG